MNILGECIEMLRKLIKYEFKCTGRFLVPMFAGIIIFALVSKVILSIKALGNAIDIISTLLNMTFFLIASVFTIAVFIVQIIQFYKSMVTDEAYTTFSLPVDVRSLVQAKLFVALAGNLLTLLVVCLSGAILMSSGANYSSATGGLKEQFQLLAQQLGVSSPLLVTFLLIMVILTLTLYNLFIETAIAMGQSFANNKIGFMFVSGVFLYLAAMVIIIAGMLIIGCFAEMESVTYYKMFSGFLFTFLIIANGILYVLTNRIFRKSLNLE